MKEEMQKKNVENVTERADRERNEKFAYSYAAPTEMERREIASIRRQYQPQEYGEGKMERLRALDNRVKNGANVVALVMGVVGCLVFGGGMALILERGQLLFGIPLSLVGMIPMLLAYPTYNAVLKRNKEKYGAEILKLSEELLGEDKD